MFIFCWYPDRLVYMVNHCECLSFYTFQYNYWQNIGWHNIRNLYVYFCQPFWARLSRIVFWLHFFFFFRCIHYFAMQCIGSFWRRHLRALFHGPWLSLHFRYSVSFKIVAGKSKLVTKKLKHPRPRLLCLQFFLCMHWKIFSMSTSFIKTSFTDLFYQSFPSKTMHYKGQKCFGGKHSKVRLTGLAAGTAFGERLLIFVIGKSQKSRWFKGVKHLLCQYRPS